MGKSSTTEQKVYEFVCFNPGKSTYEIAKKLGMTGGRVRHALNKLKKLGLIKFQFLRGSYRVKKLSFPIESWKLLPRSLKKEIQKLKLR